MEYLTSKQLSEKWGIGQCRIIRLAREGRIDGAKQFGKNWMFPENSRKPNDGRRKETKINAFDNVANVNFQENNANNKEKAGNTLNGKSLSANGTALNDKAYTQNGRSISANGTALNDKAYTQNGRSITANGETDDGSFRFPLFVNKSKESFSPALSADEDKLRTAQLDFLACDFVPAEKSFENLAKTSNSIYIKISALFFLCYISVGCHRGKDLDLYFAQLKLALSEDFPRKKEIELLVPFLFYCLSFYNNMWDNFTLDVEYEYTQEVYPIMHIVSFFNQTADNVSENIEMLLGFYETVSRQFEASGNYYEAVIMHQLLYVAHLLKADNKAMLYHLKRAVNIAYKHNFIYPVADVYMYYSDDFNTVLSDYPSDFKEKIRKFAKQIHTSFASFMNDNKITGMYTLLSNKDYQYVLFALKGYSYKQVAGIMHISERTVANRYAEIYDKLGIEGKRELNKTILEAVTRKDNNIE